MLQETTSVESSIAFKMSSARKIITSRMVLIYTIFAFDKHRKVVSMSCRALSERTARFIAGC